MAGPATVADTIDALFDLLDGHASLASYGDRLKVFDGPPVVDRTTEIEVWIGATGSDSEGDGARISERWATMGAGAASQRHVTVDVPCAVWVIGGEVDMRTRRRTAAQVLDVVAGLLHTVDPLGLAEVLCGGVEISLGVCRQLQTADGAACHWTFTVRATARV
jgi:hypothetical protein